MYRIVISLCLFAVFAGCTSSGSEAETHEHTNQLIHENSPYLLQHAHNPVDWYPWGEEALTKAKEENKLIIISVGYSSCHWCHVMEEESFEDSLVAAVMNEHFVSIKVDREERPDIDDIYMTACQMMGEGNCGWPLNAFALPNGQPVWAGTYFPKKNWLEILEYFRDLYQKDPEQLRDYARQLTDGLEAATQIQPFEGEVVFSGAELDSVAQTMLGLMDYQLGGRSGAPKFPIPNTFEFLLRYHGMTGDSLAREAVSITLRNMARGGIYDHLGGGFARYSVDARWKVPHFEKMLYDNAQLVSLYSQAWQLMPEDDFARVVRESLSFIERELRAENGGFYASLDADSEGEEGTFYVWTQEEIEAVVTDSVQASLFKDYYEINPNGNWEEGNNILYVRKSLEAVAANAGLSPEKAREEIEKAASTLFQTRAMRPRPGRDYKILTAWNGLMLKGYIDAYRAFAQPEYLDVALANADFIVENLLTDEHRLRRHFESDINAFLDDYAYVIQAFISLYEVTFDEQWLEHARELTVYTLAHFSDTESPMLYYTSRKDDPLVTRKMELYDNVIPASNSAMARNLFVLGNLYFLPEWVDRSREMLLTMWPEATASDFPDSYSNWAQLYLEQCYAPYEVAIVGPGASNLRNELMQDFLPNAHFLGGTSEGSLELLKDKLVEDETFIYVCQNKICKLPVQDVADARPLLNRLDSAPVN